MNKIQRLIQWYNSIKWHNIILISSITGLFYKVQSSWIIDYETTEL